MYNALKQALLLLSFPAMVLNAAAQGVTNRLRQAFSTFEADSQMRNGIASLYVLDARTGNVVFEKNGSIGLAPASTQKVITSITAYELLGKDFSYQTRIGVNGGNKEAASVYIRASGDPTLGSWRWNATKEDAVIGRIRKALQREGITGFSSLQVDNTGWDAESIPDGWIWQDIGNYYGAGAAGLNWRENQFDLVLRSGNNIGDPVTVVGTKPRLYNYSFISSATSAARGSGDNAYIYFPLQTSSAVLRGTIPVNESRFVISGAIPFPAGQLLGTLEDSLSAAGLKKVSPANTEYTTADWRQLKLVHTETSPPLDSIIYWFNRRSINLYGEALVKTMAMQQKGTATTDAGISVLKEHWKSKGYLPTELAMVDGSGLSPLNRVTTRVQAALLLHAKRQAYYPGFFLSLPEFNGMKMKSGTIRGVKGFAGYHKAADGSEYVFSFLVNNYNGSASSLVQKMYRVLDVLK